MSHTSGPWEVDGFDETSFTVMPRDEAGYGGGGFYVRDAAGVAVAHGVWDEKNRDAVITNARLIAAAPELLDLLRQARRRWLDAARAQEYWTPQEKDDLRRIDSSIAKAEGGAE